MTPLNKVEHYKRLMRTMLYLLCAIVAAPQAAHAGDNEKSARKSESTRQATNLFKQGMVNYNLGDFDAAVEHFKRAYELSQKPRLIFNIAQAHRLAKHYPESLFAYQTYLRLVPHASNLDDVEQHIADLEDLLEKQRKAPARPTPAELPTDQVPQEGTPPALSVAPSPRQAKTVAVGTAEASPWRWVGMGLLGGGTVALAGGIGLAIHAKNLEDSLSSISREGGAWSSSQQRRLDRGNREKLAARIGVVLGAALVIAGATVMLGHGGSDEATAYIAPQARGLAVGFRVGF